MHEVTDRLNFETDAAKAVAPLVPLASLLLILVLITTTVGVQT
jgi:hypothetical protein